MTPHNMMQRRRWLTGLLAIASCCLATAAWASQPQTLGDVAVNFKGQFNPLGKLLVAVAYISGIGFGIASIYKFKQYKDNPTQIPVGTPFALLTVSVCLVFLPGIIRPAGDTVFGDDAKAGSFDGGGVKCLPGGNC